MRYHDLFPGGRAGYIDSGNGRAKPGGGGECGCVWVEEYVGGDERDDGRDEDVLGDEQ